MTLTMCPHVTDLISITDAARLVVASADGHRLYCDLCELDVTPSNVTWRVMWHDNDSGDVIKEWQIP